MPPHPRAFLELMPYQVHGGNGSSFRSWILPTWSSFFGIQQFCPEFGIKPAFSLDESLLSVFGWETIHIFVAKNSPHALCLCHQKEIPSPEAQKARQNLEREWKKVPWSTALSDLVGSKMVVSCFSWGN